MAVRLGTEGTTAARHERGRVRALAGKKTLLVVGQQNDTVWKSVRNLDGVHTTLAHQLNAYDLLDCEQLLLTQEGLDRVKEVFAK